METVASEAIRAIPARGLNELVYCPRLYHLMYVQGLFDDSADTIEGKAQHKRRRVSAKTDDEGKEEIPWRPDEARNLTLADPELGIVGRFDVLFHDEAFTIPVEDKHGPAPSGHRPFIVGDIALSASAWDNDQIQLAAQMSLLKANGHDCREGRLYYRKTRSLVTIPWTPELAEALAWSVGEARRLWDAPMPDPLLDSPKCIRCSLNHVCLPDETHVLKGRIQEPRRLHPGRDDAGILYVTQPGTSISKDGECLKIVRRDGETASVPLKEVAQVCVFGNCQITTQALLTLTENGASVAYLTGGGWLRAVTIPPLTKNVLLRRSQFLTFTDGARCLELARGVVTAKINNQRTLLRRNRKNDIRESLFALKKLSRQSMTAESAATLRGIEGAAARVYWEEFGRLLSFHGAPFEMDGRNRRPPRDPVNAMLSYGYALLLRDWHIALAGVGLDSLFGFYHAPEPGRPSLALDMMEAFRPLIVDSTVLRVAAEGGFSPSDFIQLKGCCAFQKEAKRKWIKAYERRVDELVTHPAFGYRLSYRRVFHVEARLLSRVLEGELTNYRPLETR